MGSSPVAVTVQFVFPFFLFQVHRFLFAVIVRFNFWTYFFNLSTKCLFLFLFICSFFNSLKIFKIYILIGILYSLLFLFSVFVLFSSFELLWSFENSWFFARCLLCSLFSEVWFFLRSINSLVISILSRFPISNVVSILPILDVFLLIVVWWSGSLSDVDWINFDYPLISKVVTNLF